MSKEICISSTPHETRLAILENDELAEIYYERENEYTLAGSIYKGRVTRVLPGMQSAFVDIGLERDAFLYVTDFLEEQEDSDEFERTSLSNNGQSRDQSRREGGRSRPAQAEASASEPSGAPASEDESGDREAPSGTRRWRGRRGRGRGLRRGRDSQERENRSQDSHQREQAQDHAVEAGSEETIFDAPVIDVRMDENEASFERHASASSGDRIVLPGESLSKYGGKPGSRPAAEAPKPQAAAAPAFKPNYVPPKPSTLIETPITWDGGSLLPGESRARHSQSRPAPAPEAAFEPVAEPVAESVVEFTHDVPAAVESNLTSAPASVEVAEPVVEETHLEPVAEVATPVEPEPRHEVELHDEVFEEVHREFEPEDASASHRIDTSAPSEFRITNISEPEETFEHAPAVEVTPHEDLPEHDEQATEVADQLFGFAPGAGILEEEVIDEDEYDFEPIHAHADDQDSEDLEEETLEHTGQEISDIVRDEHLDQRLASGPGVLEAEEIGGLESDELEITEAGLDEEDGLEEVEETASADSAAPSRDREERRGGRRGDRRGSRVGRRQGRGGHRASAQTMDLPIISDLLKPGQEILLQIAKEPIAKKGARVTSHIALPGRFLVFMPTVNHVGVSRKISSDEERQRLKRILISEKGDASGGFIVRTAADGASEDELRADLRFLISLWNDIKQREESSKSPALIYHDLNLVERVLRDQVSDNFSTIWVDSESEYERILRFLNRFQPALVRRVKLYTKETPLFEQFGIQEEITKALRSKVWLKSGGSIVINQTEALVAIDINTGKYVGKTARLEDTILRTNLDAIPEIVRQIRLRDLGGIIVIDFIDMDERRNRHKVMAALEEALKADRAPSKVLQFNDFGLVAITRKRVKQSLERTLSVPCPVCAATGMVKSPATVANEIYTELRKMYRHLDRGDIMLRVNPEVVKVLKANNARWLVELEELSGKTIIVKSDPALHPEQFDIH